MPCGRLAIHHCSQSSVRFSSTNRESVLRSLGRHLTLVTKVMVESRASEGGRGGEGIVFAPFAFSRGEFIRVHQRPSAVKKEFVTRRHDCRSMPTRGKVYGRLAWLRED